MATGRSGTTRLGERCRAAFTSQKRRVTLCRVCATRRSLAIERQLLTATLAGLCRYAASGCLGR